MTQEAESAVPPESMGETPRLFVSTPDGMQELYEHPSAAQEALAWVTLQAHERVVKEAAATIEQLSAERGAFIDDFESASGMSMSQVDWPVAALTILRGIKQRAEKAEAEIIQLSAERDEATVRAEDAGALWHSRLIEITTARDELCVSQNEKRLLRSRLKNADRRAEKAEAALSGALREQQPAHNDHPLRHFDRTCPACLREQKDADSLATSTPSVSQGEATARMEKALRKIARWHNEFPSTGRFWDEPTNARPMSYGAAYGSNGERDYMRQIALNALAAVGENEGQKQEPNQKADVAERVREALERSVNACIDMPMPDGTTYTFWPCVHAIRSLISSPAEKQKGDV